MELGINQSILSHYGIIIEMSRKIVCSRTSGHLDHIPICFDPALPLNSSKDHPEWSNNRKFTASPTEKSHP